MPADNDLLALEDPVWTAILGHRWFSSAFRLQVWFGPGFTYGPNSKFMVPFWIPIIIRHIASRAPRKGPIILTTTYLECRVLGYMNESMQSVRVANTVDTKDPA